MPTLASAAACRRSNEVDLDPVAGILNELLRSLLEVRDQRA